MDNLLHKFVTPEGQEGYGLYIASILDNIYKFGMGSMIDTGIIGCGLAVIAPLNLFVLQPWSYISM